MKGVLICGGTGSRLRPLTEITNKSLLPVYDQPLIWYPLQTLLSAGITEIAVITGPEHMSQITKFLTFKEGSYNCNFVFKIQEKAGGIAQALGIAEEFAAGDDVCAILGDNIFFDDLSTVIKSFKKGAHLFLKEVDDPERFGVAEVDADGKVLSLEEKPQNPKSSYAATGCYVYSNSCFEIIRNMQPSARGELEITDLSKVFLERGELTATVLEDDWIDAGTFESLHQAAVMVRERKFNGE